MNSMYRKIIILALFFLLMTSCVKFRPESVGVVFEYDGHSKKPAPGVRLVVECNKSKLLHSYDTVKVLTYITNRKGEYRIPGFDLLSCDFMFTHAEMEGYIDANSSAILFRNSDYDTVPEIHTIVRKENITMVKLAQLYVFVKGNLGPKDFLHKFNNVYEYFFKSTLIANTLAEKSFIKKKYCNRLVTYWNKMNKEERSRVAEYRFTAVNHGNHANFKVNHQLIVNWCNADT